jgi:hypothetical protein
MPKSTKIEKDQELGQLIGNGIRIKASPDYNTISLPTQTIPAKNFFISLQGTVTVINNQSEYQYQIPTITDGGFILHSNARPFVSVFGLLNDIKNITEGTIESRMYRNPYWSPIGATIIYAQLLQLTRMAIKESGQVKDIETSEEVDVPNFVNVKAIDELNDTANELFKDIEKENLESGKMWQETKTAIRRFFSQTRIKAVSKLTDKTTKINKSNLEIAKQLKWIISGATNKPRRMTAQMLITYAQDVLIPYFGGKDVFDHSNLNTNFFSIGQVWTYVDTAGNVIYTPLTVNNLDIGYLPHSLEIRYLLDALKNVGPRLVNIQSTYEMLSGSIVEYIHKQAKSQQGENYNQPLVDNQIRVTTNCLLAGFYSDLVNDFKEAGASQMLEKEEILAWVLSLFRP